MMGRNNGMKLARGGARTARRRPSPMTQSWSGLATIRMDLFQHRYYRINKVLLTIIGQWPYQSIRARVGSLAVMSVLGTSQMIPSLIAFLKHRDDWEFVMECTIPMMYGATITAKLLCCVFNSPKMLILLNRIRADWQVWADDREVNVLHEYAEQGRQRTINYGVMVYSTGLLYMSQPIVPKIIDVLFKNGTEPGEFPYPVDYHHLDAQKYYFHIIGVAYICGFFCWLLTTANDAMFIVYVQHSCGIFAAFGHKLERIGDKEDLRPQRQSAGRSERRTLDYDYLAMCIIRHNEAIEYAELIDETYRWCFLFTMGLSILGISVLGTQIVMVAKEPRDTARFIVLLGTVMLNVFILSYMSQVLLDHSINTHNSVHSSRWYELSLRARKLLILLTMRCAVPCTLTAGKIVIMSVETFAVVLKTSLSYFTVLRSR